MVAAQFYGDRSWDYKGASPGPSLPGNQPSYRCFEPSGICRSFQLLVLYSTCRRPPTIWNSSWSVDTHIRVQGVQWTLSMWPKP